jgi:hypothetical protein
VAKGLRGVAEVAAGGRVVLLAEEADVVAKGEEAFEQVDCLIGAADAVECVCEPEGGSHEAAFATGNAVDVGTACGDGVPQYEAVIGEVSLDRVDGSDHALVVPREEAVARHQQDGRVEPWGAVGLGERVAAGMEAALGDLVCDGTAQCPKPMELRRLLVPLESSDSSIDTDPGQQLGVHEVAPGTANLPEPVVRVPPVAFDVVEHGVFELLLPGGVR